MKYKLYQTHPGASTIDNVLINRGIDPSELEDWKSASIDLVQSWSDLDNIEEFCAEVHEAIQKRKNTVFVVDPDCDGFTSAAIMINFIYSLNKQFCFDHIKYVFHEGKQHGLSDITIPEGTDLVIVMDGGTNDVEYHKQLAERGIKVIIGDHHECDDPCYDYAIIVNNQLSKKYRNKDLSGAGIAWQICRAYNDIYNTFGKVEMDMAALGLAGDMMAYNSLETRAIISNGLNRIMNVFLTGMIKKMDYNIRHSGGIHYHSISFYVVPYINAVMRVGNQEEKELLFQSMLDMYAHKHIKSTKRGEVGQYVELIDEAILTIDRVKRRQNQIQDMMVEEAKKQIENNNLLQHSMLVIQFEVGQTAAGMLGVIANKLQSLYQRPVFVFVNDDGLLKGSARNYQKSNIDDLRGYCRSSELFSLAEGHASAFGAQISQDNLQEFLQRADNDFSVDTEPVYWVDYVWSPRDVTSDKVFQIANHKEYWGQQVDEPLVVIKDIRIDSIKTELLSKDKNPTTRIVLSNGMEMIKFKSSMHEKDWLNTMYKFTVIGKCGKNEYLGNVKPQIIIEDWDVQDITKDNYDWDF